MVNAEEERVRIVHVNAGGGYDIRIGAGLLSAAGELVKNAVSADRLAVFIDSGADLLYGGRIESGLKEAGFETCRFAFKAGEASKNMDTVSRFLDFMAANHITRKDAVVAVGGGVAGDMGGFAAAIYMRGVRFIQIPTTLLAAVDSSVGGKTGVDIAAGKNLVGAFWQPSLVLCDTDTLDTLFRGQLLDGTAEIIKTAAIQDKELFELIKTTEIFEKPAEIIERCVKIKGKIVEADEKESGLRKILNFGHTMAHAIERYSDFGVSHGRAVAIGMLMVTRAAEARGLTPAGTFGVLEELMAKRGFATETEAPLDELVRLAVTDKKAAGGAIDIVYLKEIGDAATCSVKLTELYDFLSSRS